jgi:hypothetical protein
MAGHGSNTINMKTKHILIIAGLLILVVSAFSGFQDWRVNRLTAKVKSMEIQYAVLYIEKTELNWQLQKMKILYDSLMSDKGKLEKQ